MQAPSGETHKPRAVAPASFRNKATGIGQSQAMSEATGAARKACVVAAAPAGCIAKVPVAEGY